MDHIALPLLPNSRNFDRILVSTNSEGNLKNYIINLKFSEQINLTNQPTSDYDLDW